MYVYIQNVLKSKYLLNMSIFELRCLQFIHQKIRRRNILINKPHIVIVFILIHHHFHLHYNRDRKCRDPKAKLRLGILSY